MDAVCSLCRDNVFDPKRFQTIWHPTSRYGWPFPISEPLTWQTSLKQLKEGSEAQCGLCKLILGVVIILKETRLDVGQPELDDDTLFNWALWFAIDPEKMPMAFRIMYMGFDVTMYRETYDLSAHSDNPSAIHISNADLERNLTDRDTIDRIRNWVDECTDKHERCPKDSTWTMPTRVLEICSRDSDTPQKVRLISGNEKTEKYVALSYTWGVEPFLRTTTENVQDMQAGLNVSSLPQTLCDAIRVTCWLGLKYIWIDSLCILQDSAEDKDAEVSSMVNVYSHAFITISATNATSVYDSFLQAKAADYPSTILPFPCPDGRPGSIRVRRSNWYKSLSEPLNRRAWAMQERLLSPRLLEFTSLGVSWKCRNETINHKDTQGVPFFRGKEANWISWAMNCDTTEIQWDLDEALEVWDWIVKHYTIRRLTYEADRLPALGGIAQQMQRIIGGKYVAGLWGDHLHRGLLWSGSVVESDHGGSQVLRRPADSTVPTWSWASVDGSVISRDIAADEEKLFTIQIERCHYTISSQIQPFGSVDGGTMTVLAHSGWAVLEEKQEYFGQTISIGGNSMMVWPDDADQFQQAIEENQVFIIEVALHKDLFSQAWKSRGLILRAGELCTRVGFYEEIICSDEFQVVNRDRVDRFDIV